MKERIGIYGTIGKRNIKDSSEECAYTLCNRNDHRTFNFKWCSPNTIMRIVRSDINGMSSFKDLHSKHVLGCYGPIRIDAKAQHHYTLRHKRSIDKVSKATAH